MCSIAVHLESSLLPVQRALNKIRQAGMRPGLAFKLQDAGGGSVPYTDLAEYVLLLTNESDCAGIKFKPHSLERVKELRRLAPAGCEIWVDGGVTPKNLPLLAAAGADRAMSGAGRVQRRRSGRQNLGASRTGSRRKRGIPCLNHTATAFMRKPCSKAAPSFWSDAARAGFDNFELSLTKPTSAWAGWTGTGLREAASARPPGTAAYRSTAPASAASAVSHGEPWTMKNVPIPSGSWNGPFSSA